MVYRFRPTHLVAPCKKRVLSHRDSFEICISTRRCGTAADALRDLLAAAAPWSRNHLQGKRILFESGNAVVLGSDEKHLTQRCVLSVRPGAGSARTLRFETAVLCHDWIGEAWLAVLGPLLRRSIRAALRRLAHG
jgi:hypothetical protein